MLSQSASFQVIEVIIYRKVPALTGNKVHPYPSFITGRGMVASSSILEGRLTTRRKLIDSELERYLSEEKPKPVTEAAAHLPKQGGKRVRPLLLLLLYEVLTGDQASRHPERVVPAGLAGELTHTCSLIHDDLIDEDHQRRGAPAVHQARTDNTAILAGNYLFSQAFQAICDLEGAIAAGESYDHTFQAAGPFEYFCIPHEQAGMKGTVEVSSN